MYWRLLIACICFSSGMMSPLKAQVEYAIGDIPDLRAWHDGDPLTFALTSGLQGEVAFSYTGGEDVVGLITFDTSTGLFSYTPDESDLDTFDLTFSAMAGEVAENQTVSISPLPILPPEQDVFGLAPIRPLPDELDEQFFQIEISESTASSFNFQKDRTVKDIKVVGKRVVIEDAAENVLYTYHEREDVRSLEIHAETLVVRSPFHLLATNVDLYVRDLIFDDLDAENPGHIKTTPKSLTSRPAQLDKGDNGITGGAINAYIASFEDTSEQSHLRLITDGGNGQPGGLGASGPDGKNRATQTCKTNWVQVCFKKSDNVIFMELDGPFVTNSAPSKDPGWPTDGEDATPGGKPGDGGNGGTISTTLPSLAATVSQRGGVAGERAPLVSGGKAGSPKTSYKYYATVNTIKITSSRTVSHTSSAGASRSGLFPDKAVGDAGAFSSEVGPLKWMSPEMLRMAVLYIREAYRYGYIEDAALWLQGYGDQLAAYMASGDWESVSVGDQVDLQNLAGEIQSMRHRLANGLDYFGNPAGWVPMLSFEINQLAYNQEIDYAINVLYLNYWLMNKADTLQSKQDSLNALKDQLKEEYERLKQAYDSAMIELPVLEANAISIDGRINQLKTDIQSLENELLPKAKEKAFIRKTAQAVGAIAEVIPVYQPALGLAGNVVAQLPDVDPEKPWYENTFVIGQNVAGQMAADGTSISDVANSFSDESEYSEELTTSQKIALLNQVREPLMEFVSSGAELMDATSGRSEEVQAELNKLLADSPEYKDIIAELKVLNEDKIEFARKLAEVFQTLNSTAVGMTRNLYILDKVSTALSETSAKLDFGMLSVLSDMNQRARERLEKYHYYMVKAYEYRLLKPYEGLLNLNDMFDRFVTFAEDDKEPHSLSKDDFDVLKSLYEEPISAIADEILTQYNSNPPEESVTDPFAMSQAQIDELNETGTTQLNLIEEGIFFPNEENIRIVGLQIVELDLDYIGGKENVQSVQFEFEHSGISRLRSDGYTYLFRHYNQDTRNKITWKTRFSPSTGNLNPVQPSAAGESLLISLLSRQGNSTDSENLLLYSRPAAWADLNVTLRLNTKLGASVDIKRVLVELVYDYVPAKDNLFSTLSVETLNEDISPLLQVSKDDVADRRHGRGKFLRTFSKFDTVEISAPGEYGNWEFSHWLGVDEVLETAAKVPSGEQGYSTRQSDRVIARVTMDDYKSIAPVYVEKSSAQFYEVSGTAVGEGIVTGSGQYENGSQVSLTATPESGNRFLGWSGDLSSSDNPLVLDVSSDVNVVAQFGAALDSPHFYSGSDAGGEAFSLYVTGEGDALLTGEFPDDGGDLKVWVQVDDNGDFEVQTESHGLVRGSLAAGLSLNLVDQQKMYSAPHVQPAQDSEAYSGYYSGLLGSGEFSRLVEMVIDAGSQVWLTLTPNGQDSVTKQADYDPTTKALTFDDGDIQISGTLDVDRKLFDGSFVTSEVSGSFAVLEENEVNDLNRLGNISTRGIVGNEAAFGMHAGFFIKSDAGPKKVLLLGKGPSLAESNVANVLTNPQLQLYRITGTGSELIYENQSWQGASNADEIQLYAPIVPSESYPDEAAMIVTLDQGLYSVVLTGEADAQGQAAIVEIYELEDQLIKSLGKLVNISTRGPIGQGDEEGLFAGFLVSGSNKKVLIMGKGPSLADSGVPDALMDPQLKLFQLVEGAWVQIKEVSRWVDESNAEEIRSNPIGLKDEYPEEVGTIIDLEPGLYSVIISREGTATGSVAIVEVYELVD